jgi:hypothetical protein
MPTELNYQEFFQIQCGNWITGASPLGYVALFNQIAMGRNNLLKVFNFF